MNFIYMMPKVDFRKVSEALRTSTLLHSIVLHSILLHSTNVSSLGETNVYKRYSRPGEFDMFWALTMLGGSTWGRRQWNGRVQESTKTLQNKACLDHVAPKSLYVQRVWASMKRQYQKTSAR